MNTGARGRQRGIAYSHEVIWSAYLVFSDAAHLLSSFLPGNYILVLVTKRTQAFFG